MSRDNGERIGSGGIDGLNGAPRIRRSTLERFNDELSVLDRPLDADVEYYDEEPPSKRPRMVAIALAALLVIGGGGGFLLLSRHLGGAAPRIELAIAPAAAPVAAATAETVAMPAPAATPTPAVAAAPEPALEPAEVEIEAEVPVDTVARDAPSVATAVAPSAWGKLGKAGAQHARSTKASQQHRTRR